MIRKPSFNTPCYHERQCPKCSSMMERQDNEFNTFGFSAQDQLKIKEKKIPHHICRVCREYNDLAYDYLFFNRRWYQFNRGEWKKFYTSFKKEVVQFT